MEGTPMQIKLTSVYVDDQEKALRFYTEVLGFVKKADFSQGPYRWLTVASPEEPDGTELQLALNNNPAAKAYQQAIFEQGEQSTGHLKMRVSRGSAAFQGPTQGEQREAQVDGDDTRRQQQWADPQQPNLIAQAIPARWHRTIQRALCGVAQ